MAAILSRPECVKGTQQYIIYPPGALDGLLAEATSQPVATMSSMPVSQPTASAGITLTSPQPAAVPAANNLNLTNLAGLPGNINLANLGLANLPAGLTSIQVSLANVTVPGGIALPLSVINSGPTIGQPTGILVSSLPGTASTATTTATTPASATVRLVVLNSLRPSDAYMRQ